GLGLMALCGSSLAAHDATVASAPSEHGGDGDHDFLSTLDGADPFAAMALFPNSEGERDRGEVLGNGPAVVPEFRTTGIADTPLFAEDQLARHVLLQRLGVSLLPGSPASPADFIGTPTGTGAPWSGVSESYSS